MQIWAKNHIFGHGCAVHGPWFMVQDSSVTFIPHSSLVILRFFTHFSPLWQKCQKRLVHFRNFSTFLPSSRRDSHFVVAVQRSIS